MNYPRDAGPWLWDLSPALYCITLAFAVALAVLPLVIVSLLAVRALTKLRESISSLGDPKERPGK